MNRMMSILACTGLCLCSCQENDFGSGANTVVREYSISAPQTSSAARRSAEAAGFTLTSDNHDQLGGEIVARRANGCEVRIDVKSIDERSSRVSVRIEPGDRALATQLQERIAEKAGLGTASPSLLGGNCARGTYGTDLEACRTSALHAFTALQVTPTGEERHAAWVHLDGRLRNSTPVRIKLESLEPQKTQVTFIAGTETTEDTKVLAQRMKEEFEKGTPSD